jgi:hypothetical protein
MRDGAERQHGEETRAEERGTSHQDGSKDRVKSEKRGDRSSYGR